MKILVDTAITVPVNVAPLISDSDFKTIDEGIAYNESGMDLNWNFETKAGVITQTNVVPTTGGDYDWSHVGNGMYKIEIPASGGVSANNDSEGFGWFSGICDGVLPFIGPKIQFSPANVINSLVDGSDKLQVDTVEINSVAQRAVDLAEIAQYFIANSVTLTDVIADNSIIAQLLATDGDISGFAKGTDALQSIRDAIIASNPQNHSATANTETTGTLDSGTYADTETANTTYWQTSPVTPAVGGFGLNVSLDFNIGVGRVPSSMTVTGYFSSGAQRTVQVWAYNYNTGAYVQLSNSTNDFNNAGSNSTKLYTLSTNMVNPATGAVSIRFTSTSVTTGDNWYCDFVQVRSVAQEASGLTADVIQKAVWNRNSLTAGFDHQTLGFVMSNIFACEGTIQSVTSAKQFICDTDWAVNDAYNGNVILVEDVSAGFYDIRRVVDYIGATKEIFLDRDLSFTPETGDHYFIMGTAYSDVNTTHVSGTEQTANDNGADINTILSRVVGTLLSGSHSPQSGDGYDIVNNGTYGNSALDTDLNTLLTRITSDRSGYLDNISGGAVSLESTSQSIKTITDQISFTGSDVKATLDSEEVDIGFVKGIGVTDIDDFKADVSTLAIENNVESHLSGALSAYDPPTRNELTSDKDEIIVQVNNNEIKIDTIDTNLDTMLTRLSAIRSGYLDNLSGGAVSLQSTLTTLASVSALETTLTAMKGSGWTNETLKTIQDAVEAISGDATLANQVIIKATLALMQGSGFATGTDSLEAIRNRGDVAWVTGGGVGGSSTVTITIQDDDGVSIPDVSVQIWNTNLDSVISYGTTNSNGIVELTADDDDYYIKVRKATYSFDATTAITVSGDTSKTITGTGISIDEPEDGTNCRVYEYCYKLDGSTPADSVIAIANITTLPYDSGTVLHAGIELEGTYDEDTGLVYWDIVQGATVEFIIKEYGMRKIKVVPSTSTARLNDL